MEREREEKERGEFVRKIDIQINELHCICTYTAQCFTGEYWIDPTEGSHKDAFKVYCSGQETCIRPVKNSNEVMYSYMYCILI